MGAPCGCDVIPQNPLSQLQRSTQPQLLAHSSSVDQGLGGLANLEILSLGWNALSGPIPTELGSLARLELLDLWKNKLSGPIPAELGHLADLETLYLNDNQLS